MAVAAIQESLTGIRFCMSRRRTRRRAHDSDGLVHGEGVEGQCFAQRCQASVAECPHSTVDVRGGRPSFPLENAPVPVSVTVSASTPSKRVLVRRAYKAAVALGVLFSFPVVASASPSLSTELLGVTTLPTGCAANPDFIEKGVTVSRGSRGYLGRSPTATVIFPQHRRTRTTILVVGRARTTSSLWACGLAPARHFWRTREASTWHLNAAVQCLTRNRALGALVAETQSSPG